MRKTLPFLLIGIFALSSCNFPLTKSTPDPMKVQTSVAQTMTALVTSTSPATATIAPSATGEPTATPTLTVTPTATTSPDDPRKTLGSPDFTDTFTSKTAFGLQNPYEDDAVRIEVNNGAMIFTSIAAQHGKRWRLTAPMPRNLYLEGTFTTSICSGFDTYGLVLRSPSYSDGIGYYFGLACNGQVSAMRWDSSGTHTILDWMPAPSANAGQNQTNRLGIMAIDDEFKIYVNGTLVTTIKDDVLTAKGHFGVYVSAVESPNFTFSVNELDEWNQP